MFHPSLPPEISGQFFFFKSSKYSTPAHKDLMGHLNIVVYFFFKDVEPVNIYTYKLLF